MPSDGPPASDRQSGVPLFRQVGDQLATDIADGSFRDEHKLPSVKQLAERYSVSVGTMQRVLRDLTGQGLVRGVRGSGIFITRNHLGPHATRELRVSPMLDMFTPKEVLTVRERFGQVAPECQLTESDVSADVFTMHGDDIPALAGRLVDVTDVVEDVYGRPPNDRRLFSALHVAGRQLMLPTVLYTMTTICNKQLFEDAGIPFPAAGWTWDDFVATAQALTDRENGRYGFCLPNDLALLFQSGLWQDGGRVFSSDGKRCLLDDIPGRRFAELFRKLSACTAPDRGCDANGGLRHWALFARGNVAMTFGGNWFPWRLFGERGDVRWTAVPLPRGRREVGVVQAFGFGIRKDSPRQESAGQFLRVVAKWERWPDKIDHAYGLRLHRDLARTGPVGEAYEHMASHSRTPLSDVAPEHRTRRHYAALRLLESPLRRALRSDEPLEPILADTRRNMELVLADNGPLARWVSDPDEGTDRHQEV